jgi:hypothetical protein
MRGEDAPVMRATSSELAVAPELGVLVALDAVLAVAAFQLAAENPDTSLDALARGDPPSPQARKATALILRIANLRVVLRDYRDLSLTGYQTDLSF